MCKETTATAFPCSVKTMEHWGGGGGRPEGLKKLGRYGKKIYLKKKVDVVMNSDTQPVDG
jgi:hypothetical protein